MRHEDLLIEIQTEELPGPLLLPLAKALQQNMLKGLQAASLTFSKNEFFVTPRRFGVRIDALSSVAPSQTIERKGPAKAQAFTADGAPTPACLGFARSLGVTPDALISIANQQGEWVGYQQTVEGQSVQALLPAIVAEAIRTLPPYRRMRWGDADIEFIRPVHGVVMLYGSEVIKATILGCQTQQMTVGHRFLATEAITIQTPNTYLTQLETEGFVIADFVKRQQKIVVEAKALVKEKVGSVASLYVSSQAFLDEVTGLTEWPVALMGTFAKASLVLPKEVLISAMEKHQRYFPVLAENGVLLPYFVVISNIPVNVQAPERVIHGNERVLRARLADAQFFYEEDKKQTLASRVERLKNSVFLAKLGTLFDKTERLQYAMQVLANLFDLPSEDAKRAALLAKTDLLTHMVQEFPELQGVMGDDYARCDGEEISVATALREQYLPRFAKDQLPESSLGQMLALIDRLDTLVGAFATGQIPTGDKDPFALRRRAVGVLRILIEKQHDIDLVAWIETLFSAYEKQELSIDRAAVCADIIKFFTERLRVFYHEQGIGADIFASVAALQLHNPYDMARRIGAVKTFMQQPEAMSLAEANKRVSHLLASYAGLDNISKKAVQEKLLTAQEEKNLLIALQKAKVKMHALKESGDYTAMLLSMTTLKEPIDQFFEKVMVMVEDEQIRENRMLLLFSLRHLFLQVADISQLKM